MPRRALLLFVWVGCGPQKSDSTMDNVTEGPSSETGAQPSTGDPGPPTTGMEPSFCEVQEPIPEAEFPQVIAEVVCARRAACGCAEVEDCGADFVEHFSGLRAYAAGEGLVYDGACLARRLAEYAASGCSASEYLARERCVFCYVYSGEAGTGESCSASFLYGAAKFLNACEGVENFCFSVQCEPPAGEGQECNCVEDCKAGLACSGGVCHSAMPGEPCQPQDDEVTGCAEGLWCDGLVCRLPRGIGESCGVDTQCLTGRCSAGQCVDFMAACEPGTPHRWF